MHVRKKLKSIPINLDLTQTNNQVFEFIQNKASAEARQSLNSANGDSTERSPLSQKLDSMILTLQMFRQEMDGSRIPKFEENYLRRQQELEDRRMNQRRRDRKSIPVWPGMQRVNDDLNRNNSIINGRKNNKSLEPELKVMLNSNQRKMSQRQTFNQYRINDYEVSKTSPQPSK